jgi:hypothetical protein
MKAEEPLRLFRRGLDQRDAAVVSSPRVPDDIRREAGPGLDGRYAFFDSPDTRLTMLCRYRQVVTSGS